MYINIILNLPISQLLIFSTQSANSWSCNYIFIIPASLHYT